MPAAQPRRDGTHVDVGRPGAAPADATSRQSPQHERPQRPTGASSMAGKGRAVGGAPRARRRRRRLRGARAALVAAAALLVFAVGLALGRALEEGPAGARTITSVRTLKPLPLAPPAKTVTITVTSR